MISESTLASMQPPDKMTIKVFRNTFFHESNDPFPMLGGASASLYDDIENSDLVVHHLEDLDKLTMFVKYHLGFLFMVRLYTYPRSSRYTRLNRPLNRRSY